MYVDKLNFMKFDSINGRMDSITKIRYNDKGSRAVLEQIDNSIKVFFGNGVNAITPGQAAVFYDGKDVIGGGWIRSSFQQNKKESLIKAQIK